MANEPVGTNGITSINGLDPVSFVDDMRDNFLTVDNAIVETRTLVTEGDELVAAETIAAATEYADKVAPTKSAMISLSLPTSATSVSEPASHVRIPVKVGARVPSFRVQFRNWNDRNNLNYPGDLTFSGVFIGKRAKDSNGVFTQNFDGAPTALSVPFAIDMGADGKRWTTTIIEYVLEPGVEYLLSYGFTSPAGQANHLGVGGCYRGLVPSAAGAETAGSMTQSGQVPLDVVISAYVPTSTPVYTYVGSSTVVGAQTEWPIRDSFATRHAIASGAIGTLFGGSGLAMETYTNTGLYAWKKIRAYAKPDLVFMNLHSNDVYSTATLQTIKDRNTVFMGVLRSQLNNQIVYLNVAPRANEAADIKVKREAYNSWLSTLPNSAVATYDVASIVTSSTGLDPIYDSGDGVHLNSLGQAKTAEAMIVGDQAALEKAKAYALEQDVIAEASAVNLARDYTNSVKFVRGNNLVTDLNNATLEGRYTFTGTPPANNPTVALATIDNRLSGSTIVQEGVSIEAIPRKFTRRRNSGVWTAWEDDRERAMQGRNVVPTGGDLNTYLTPPFNGDWCLSTPLLPTYLNLPAGLTVRGTLEVIAPNTFTVTQRITPTTGDITYWRQLISPTGPTWAGWKTQYLGTPNTEAPAVTALPNTDWVHWGDSLTENIGVATADKWVTKLAAKTGKNHINEGWSGQLAAQIAARQGGNTALVTVAGGSIPASGTGVLVTAATPHISIPAGTQYPTRQVPGKLAGRTGYLADGGSVDVTDATFTPTDGLGASAATGKQVFTPTGSADTGRSRVMTICIGENDIFGSGQKPQQIAYMARQMHDFQSTLVRRVLVLSIPLRAGSGASTSTGVKTLAINAALKAEFPSQYVDLAEYLMTAQAATDAGITYTADDLTDIADGVTPRSFRLPSDSVHFNALGSTIVAEYVYQAARSRGWV